MQKKKIIIKEIIAIILIFMFGCINMYSYANSGDLALYVSANNDENNVALEWRLNNEDEKEYTYRIYRAQNNTEEFKAVSTTSFEKTNSSRVNVLNVYPATGENVVFTYKDGTTETLPKSALLKVWMEGGTITYQSGETETYDNYGRNPKNNEQIIFVDLVTMDEFNENPSIINNYDVCMFGTWDYNGRKDLTEVSKLVVEEYIQKGKGVLCGHDTVGDVLPNFWSLREYFNISKYTDWDFGSTVVIAKKGLLTNFPWEIGDIGTELTVPKTHNKQSANGDIWLEFDREKSSDNFYLTSYQNTALIQTGHSNGSSTEDERKVLANTLFYLNQLTNSNSAVDNGGQDLADPDSVQQISNTVKKSTKKATIEFGKPNDNGTKYTYYVEGIDENNNKIRSDEKNVTVTTGIKGYNYIIDNNPLTEAGYDINLTKESIEDVEIDWSKDTYLHIRSIDGAKNYSETTHYKIEQKNIIDDGENTPVVKEDKTTAKSTIPQTGSTITAVLVLISVLLISIILFVKYRKVRDI